MEKRPKLTKEINPKHLRSFYYLKEEFLSFCRTNNLQTTGSKEELLKRIEHYLKTGKKLQSKQKKTKQERKTEIKLDDIIEANFVCSEQHRAFYKKEIGTSFSFCVPFQKWLKANTGKTYQDSIMAYKQILEQKKKGATKIDKQFEYNTYIRDFFQENKNKSLKQAITCWKYKKSLPGSHHYEKEDLIILQKGLLK